MTRSFRLSLLVAPAFMLATQATARSVSERDCAAIIPDSSATPSDCTIIVTGALPDPASDAAYSIIRIDAERLNGTASGRIEDALRDVAGLQQFRRTDARSANATSQGATLRGLGGNASSRALLVLDGVPQTDPFGGWVTWPAFAANRLGRITVTRGGGSGAFGSGALSGTIEMDSISRSNGLSAGLAYGSRQSVEAHALLGGALGAGRGFVTASYARGDGFVPIVPEKRGPTDIAAPYEQASLAARGVLPVSGTTELQAGFLAFIDRRERGTILSSNGGDGADASLRLVHRGRWGIEALAYAQVRKFESRFVSVNAARDTVTQTVDQYNVPSTGIGARFEIRPPLGDDVEVRLGADARRTVGRTKELFTYVNGAATRGRDAGGSATTLGAFAELTAQTGGLTLTGSVRADRWRLGAGHLTEQTLATGALLRNDRSTTRSGWEPTGRAGLAWQNGPLRLRGAAYLGWRLPTLNELYRPFRVGADATAANAALEPERMKGAELGADFEQGPLTLRITGHVSRLKDAIGNVSLGTGPGTFPGVGFVGGGGVYRQRLNLDAVRSHGVEAEANVRAGDWHLDASYAWTRARVKGSGAAAPLNGLRPAQVPAHLVSATVGWKSLSATARYVAAQYEDDSNSRKLRDALTFDAVMHAPVSKTFSLFLRAENLTNARVETAISGTGLIERATPRTFWIGVKFEGK